MKKTGLFYGASTKKTALIGKEIQEAFGPDKAEVIAVEEATKEEFERYDNLIVGASTWFDGELPTYWDELLPDLEGMKFKGKKVAIFGLGDQEGYPENFVDGIGLLAEFFESLGAEIVGFTPTEGYTFEGSKAIRDGKFLGLAIDQENQADKTPERIAEWVKQLKKAFA